VGSHHRRVRYCDDCLSGEHDLDRDSWRTNALRLVRMHCACDECDCTFSKVLIEEPMTDQRHVQTIIGRKRRPGGRHAA